MTGTLGLFSLTDLVQLLATSSRSGTLTIAHPAGPAHVTFASGDVRHAEFLGLSGMEAFHALFVDGRGTFTFADGAIDGPVTVFGSSQATLLEAARRVDEARRVEEPDVVAVPPDAIATPTGRHVVDPSRLSAVELRILKAADGVRTVLKLAESCALPFDEVSRIVERLVAADLLDASRRRPRTARLVVRAVSDLPHGTVGVDTSWSEGWEHALGRVVSTVECRGDDGTVEVRTVVAHELGAPFLTVGNDSMILAGWHVDQPFLVRPASEEAT